MFRSKRNVDVSNVCKRGMTRRPLPHFHPPFPSSLCLFSQPNKEDIVRKFQRGNDKERQRMEKKREHNNWKEIWWMKNWSDKAVEKRGYRQRLWQLIWGKRPVWHKQRLDTAENLQKFRNLQSMLQVAWQNSFMYAGWEIQGLRWPSSMKRLMNSTQSSLLSLQRAAWDKWNIAQ